MTILHITDMHFGQSVARSYLPAMRTALLSDLHYLVASSSEVSLVLFTGDVAYSGQEFDDASVFLDQLREATGVIQRDASIICCPGNHDLRRPDDGGMFTRLLTVDSDYFYDQLQRALRSPASNEFLEQTREAFQWYVKWLSTISWLPDDIYTGLLPGDMVARVPSVHGGELGLLALNSSLMHMRDGVTEGEIRLFEDQLDYLVMRELDRGPADSYILLTHHPRQWMSQSTTRLLDDLVGSNLPIGMHLFGHRHVSEFTSLTRGTDPHSVQSLQGRSLFGLRYLRDNSTERLHGYALLDLDLGGGSVRIAPRSAVPRPAGGVDFEAERGRNWFLPKGSDWTDTLPIRTSDRSAPPTAGRGHSFRPSEPGVEEVTNEARIEIDPYHRLYRLTFSKRVKNLRSRDIERLSYWVLANRYPDNGSLAREYYARHPLNWEQIGFRAWDEFGPLDVQLGDDLSFRKEFTIVLEHAGTSRPIAQHASRSIGYSYEVSFDHWGAYLDRPVLFPTQELSVVVVAPSHLSLDVTATEFDQFAGPKATSPPIDEGETTGMRVWRWSVASPTVGSKFRLKWEGPDI